MIKYFSWSKLKEEEPAFIFHHLPKCCGTSLVELLCSWFSILRDYDSEFASPADFRECAVDYSKLGAETLLCGHFNTPGFYLRDRYPAIAQDTKYRIFTFLRDPLQQQISLYYYISKHHADMARLEPKRFESLDIFLKNSSNFLASQFPCNETNVRECLDRYFFIGLAERADESVRKLLQSIQSELKDAPETHAVRRMRHILKHRCSMKLGVANRCERDRQVDQLPLDVVEQFRQNNYVDYMIYEEAKRRFDVSPIKGAVPVMRP